MKILTIDPDKIEPSICTSFGVLLKEELEKRIKKNPRFSIRSFSRILGISAASVSRIIRGKQYPDPKLILKLSNKLGFSQKKTNQLIEDSVKQKLQHANLGTTITKNIDDTTFEILSSWIYYAILKLTSTAEFKPSFEWIAKRVGIDEQLAKRSVETLVLNGYLLIKDEKWIDLTYGSTSHLKTKNSNQTIKRFLLEMNQLSSNSIIRDSLEWRNHTGTMIGINRNSIPLAKELISNFRRSIEKIMESETEKPNEVYYLNIGFFPVTRI